MWTWFVRQTRIKKSLTRAHDYILSCWSEILSDLNSFSTETSKLIFLPIYSIYIYSCHIPTHSCHCNNRHWQPMEHALIDSFLSCFHIFQTFSHVSDLILFKNQIPEFEEFLTLQRLCHEVRDHIIGRTVFNLNISLFNLVSNEEISNIDCSASLASALSTILFHSCYPDTKCSSQSDILAIPWIA